MNLKSIYINYLQNTINKQCRTTKACVDSSRPVFANNRNSAGFNEVFKEFIFTLNVKSANGSHFIDTDGNKYLDISMGFGVHLFGHNSKFIEEAIKTQLEHGIILGPIFQNADKVAKLINEMTGNERCAFYNSGTEAVMVAMRLARAGTGKNKIVIFKGCYHGSHDSLLGLKNDDTTHVIISSVPGVTQSALNETMLLEYGLEESLEHIERNSEDIAGVLLEPVMSRHPEIFDHSFLKKIRTICTSKNIALIFDEVITGFRFGNGGAAYMFNISADICVYGKIVGGGLPIGIVAGKRTYLDKIDGGMWSFGDDSKPSSHITFTAGTFNHHPLAMATATVVLEHLKKHQNKIQDDLNKLTSEMCSDLNAFFDEEGYDMQMVYFSSLFRFKLKGNARTIFYSLLKEKIYIWEGRNCFLSTAHTENDITYLKEKVRQCCFELHAAGIIQSKKVKVQLSTPIWMQTGIQINKNLDFEKLAYACNYLFTSIKNLRHIKCNFQLEEDCDKILNTQLFTSNFNIVVEKKGSSTIIYAIVDRNFCDGWSLMLFFKYLANVYRNLINAVPLPNVVLEEKIVSPVVLLSNKIKSYNKAETIFITLPYKKSNTQSSTKLFPFLLYIFYGSLLECKETPKPNLNRIIVPVAGQLIFRKLKAFGQYSLLKPIKFLDDINMEKAEIINFIDNQIKGFEAMDNFQINDQDIVFNFDNLDFNLDFDGSPAHPVNVNQHKTGYLLVCNVTKTKTDLILSLKYNCDYIKEQQAYGLLKTYANRLKAFMNEDF